MNGSIYKFCASADYAPEILSGRLKFTPPSELNDPSELMPRFDFVEVRESLADLRSRGHSERELVGLHQQSALMDLLCPELRVLAAPKTRAEADNYISLSIFDDMELVYATFSEMTQRISSRVGVCCLTRKISSLPMWSHYANRAKGYAVEYSDLDSVFPGDETGLLNCVREVIYSREISGVSFYPDSYDRIFFTKFRDWSYENEFRIVCRLQDCEKVEINGETRYLRSAPPETIASVTLGWMMSPTD